MHANMYLWPICFLQLVSAGIQKRLHAMLSPCIWQRKEVLDSICTYEDQIWSCQKLVEALKRV